MKKNNLNDKKISGLYLEILAKCIASINQLIPTLFSLLDLLTSLQQQ